MSMGRLLLQELRDEYLKELPQTLETIKSSSHDLKALACIFHKLKGSGKTYGITAITTIATPLENLCLKGDRTKLQEHLEAAIELLHDICISHKNDQSLSLENDARYQSLLRTT